LAGIHLPGDLLWHGGGWLLVIQVGGEMFYVSYSERVAKVTDCIDCLLPDQKDLSSYGELAPAIWEARHSGLTADLTDVQDTINKECGYYHVCHVINYGEGRIRFADHSQSTWDSIKHLDNDRIIDIGRK
jgi:hypothetical protein